MADFLLRMAGIEIVLGMGRYLEKEILSLRTSSHEIYAGQVMQAIVDDLGSAGGHGMIAGAQIGSMQGDHTVLRELESTLTKRLLKTLGIPFKKGSRLIVS